MNQPSPFFSIIITYKNSEKTIKYCIDSILEQNFQSYEILCINNNSNDNTLKTIKTLQEKNNINIIHSNENNNHFYINDLHGEYLLFINADDWLHYRALSFFYRDLANSDIDCYLYGEKYVTNEGEYLDTTLEKLALLFPNKIFQLKEAKKEFCTAFKQTSSKIIKRALLIENALFLKDKEKTIESYKKIDFLLDNSNLFINNTPFYFKRITEHSPKKTASIFRHIKPGHKLNHKNLKYAFLNVKKNIRSLIDNFRITTTRRNYTTVLNKIQKKYKTNQKINVCFLFNEFEKIKTESLINELSKNKKFNVKIFITSLRGGYNETKQQSLEKIENFCIDKKIDYKNLYNKTSGSPIPINSEEVDILFYQQPWAIHKCHSIQLLSKNTLTFYIPYFVPNYGVLSIDCQTFHSLLFRFYVLNSDYATEYINYKKELQYNIKVVGHTMLDYYKYYSDIDSNNKNIVVYAPHWSIGPKTINLSTFIWSGYTILDFAETHPEINWVFRPHPNLFPHLLNKGIMSKAQIDDYIARWAKIAKFDTTISYLETFARSNCLITDCGSFLSEYFPLGKPVIRLVNDLADQPCDALKSIINLYYNTYSSNELIDNLNKLLIQNKDSKKEQRSYNAGIFFNNYISNNSCTKLIIQDIESILNN